MGRALRRPLHPHCVRRRAPERAIAAVGIAGLAVVWLLTADLRPLVDAGWVFFRIGTSKIDGASFDMDGTPVIGLRLGARYGRSPGV
jgi:hypothetical protein